jgi:hypothetical protein
MAIAFNGAAKLITLSSGTTSLDVIDLYSEWKRWVAIGNANFLPAFAPVGGDPIDATAGTAIPLYAFLINGWKIRPQEANHTLSVFGGVLVVEGGGDPFVNTIGEFTVRISYQQPVQAIAISTTGGGGSGITVDQIWSRSLESGLTIEQSIRIILAALAGKTIGAGTSNEQYMSQDEQTVRIDATFVGNERSTIVLNGG